MWESLLVYNVTPHQGISHPVPGVLLYWSGATKCLLRSQKENHLLLTLKIMLVYIILGRLWNYDSGVYHKMSFQLHSAVRQQACTLHKCWIVDTKGDFKDRLKLATHNKRSKAGQYGI